MFKIYDLNYKEIPFPMDRLGYGLRGLNIHFGPVTYNTVFTESNGADKVIKRYPVDREVSIEILFTSKDTHNWRIKRDEVYKFFRRLGVFLSESHQPFKILKVMVDESYDINREILTWGESEIPLKVLETPFKKSLHTTQDLNNEGVQFNNKWAHGMGISSNEKEWVYSFENEQPTFYNAGDEEIKLIKQKESEITITFNEAARWIEIYDGQSVFRLNERVESGDVLKFKGHLITLNDQNILGDTNATFLTIKEGWNHWEVRNVNKFEFTADFRFLYD